MPDMDRFRPVVIAILGLLAAVALVALAASIPERGRPGLTVLTSARATSASVETTAAPTERAEIPVYLVGEVVHPGIYHVTPGTYLYELVELAGGLTPEAASDRINLVLRIDDSRLIRITSLDEAAGLPLPDDGVSSGGSGVPAKVNINTAGQAELETLSGIGPSTAHAIIAFREANGAFRTVEEIMNVPGIKQSRFNAIRDSITT